MARPSDDAGLSFLSGGKRSMFSHGKVLTEKYRSRCEDDFSANLKGMTLPGREEHGSTFA